MIVDRSPASLSRRTAIAGLAAGGLGAALAPSIVARQASPEAMATHPMVGAWLGITPLGPAPVHILADGAFLGSSGPISVDAEGTITYSSPQTGTWEPAGERRIHFTSVQSTYDAAGTYTGTVTIDGYPEASEDGETFYDPATEARLTIRDPAGAVLAVIEPLPPVYGSRLRPGEPVFLTAPPVATPGASPMAGQPVDVELGDFYITPATTTFQVNQAYTFVVTNTSAQQVHEFVLEPAGAIDAPLESAEGEEAEIEDIAPGATVELTWTFTEAGAYQFACYVVNHHELGMITQITVTN